MPMIQVACVSSKQCHGWHHFLLQRKDIFSEIWYDKAIVGLCMMKVEFWPKAKEIISNANFLMNCSTDNFVCIKCATEVVIQLVLKEIKDERLSKKA